MVVALHVSSHPIGTHLLLTVMLVLMGLMKMIETQYAKEEAKFNVQYIWS